ncbi:DUF6297 family protein [Streptosporangium carneum]|uniref:Uncharacterized protein n=1 Tax=Streptosporangium carneum TaxID=47481 RepID=A0A9W6MD23_9ACTN|nr:DUF6297 family protein [Streptosporangium carneum]GLK09460.1 hypothetical protein GCM10017600_28660 [Streptosporangium carneum]
MRSWQDRYAASLSAAVAIAIVGQPLVSVLGALARQADPGRISSGLALVAVAYAGYLTLVRTAGPVVLGAADASWRLLSPLPRRTVLGRTALALLTVSVLGGLVLGVALVAVLGAPDQLSLRLAAALVLGLGAGLGGMAMGVLGQASPAWDGWLRALIAVIVVAAVVLAVLGAGPGRHLPAVVAGAPAGPVGVVAGCAAAVTALLVRRAWTALGRVPARAILAASVRAGRVAQAAVVLDPGMLTWVVEDNHWRGRTLRSRRWPVTGAWALAWQEARRLGRRPARLAVLAGAAALPALVVTAGLPQVAVALTPAGALAAAASVTSGVRRDDDNPALLRVLAVEPRAALAVRALPSALLGALWLDVAFAGLSAVGASPGGLWWLLGPACGPALAVAALRMARRRPVDHSMPVIDTPGGAIPTGPLLWALTGVDLALLGCAPALLALAVQPANPVPYLLAQALTGLGVLWGYIVLATRGGRRRTRTVKGVQLQ